MELTLKVMTGRNAGQMVRVPVNKFLIGRSDDCHLRPHSDLISRHHCAILIDNGVVAVRDFNSRNGTFVNGEKVVGQTTLKTGDKLLVGELIFEVHASHGEPLQRRPKVKDVRDAASRLAAPQERDEDTDVSEWLMDDTSVVAAAETTASDLTQTQYSAPRQRGQSAERPAPVGGPDHVDSSAANKTSDSKAGLGTKKLPGKLPTIPAVATKDSREAAAEMLKKILRSR
ncbi:MAG: FHA domain-containing protein [Pirellulaceae bacterium]